MTIAVFGANYRTASVAQREQIALSPAQVRQLLHEIRHEHIFDEAVLLSTCNRTEIYYTAADPAAPLEHFLEHLAAIKGGIAIDRAMFYELRGLAAVEHLFEVAGSLDSQIVGEHEIIGQVKTAYQLATDAGTCLFTMNRLMHWTFRVGKRVFSQTQLGQGTASVAQAAVDLSQKVFSSLAGKAVLLVGAGQTAEQAAQALLQAGAAKLVVANRTPARAEELAARLRLRPFAKLDEAEGQVCPAVRRWIADHCSLHAKRPAEMPVETAAIGLDGIAEAIATVDLVISSTGATEPVLTQATVGKVLAARRRPLLMVDIAVPRDVEEALGRLDRVFLYNIDDLNRLVEENLHRRRQEIPMARRIIQRELQGFARWLQMLDVVPTIKLLQAHATALQEGEIARYARKFPPEQREQLEAFARGLCNKLLHHPMAFLREHSKHKHVDPAALELIRRLFALEEMAQNSDGGEGFGEGSNRPAPKPTQASAPPAPEPQPGERLGIEAKIPL